MNRRLAKRFADFAAGVVIAPWPLIYTVKARVLGKDHAYEWLAQSASRWAGLSGIYLRRALYRRVVSRIGRNVVISYGTLLNKTSVELGDNVYIGGYSILGDVRIGADTLIADHVVIPSGNAQHGVSLLDRPIKQQPGVFRTIFIGTDCWIGSGAVILADVGSHCVIAAGAVVTSRVEDFKIVAGNPARVIADRRERAAESQANAD